MIFILIMILEMEKKLLAAIESKSEPEPEKPDEAITEITKALGSITDAVAPLLEEQRTKRELSERKSILIKEEEERISQLPYKEQLRMDMLNIIATVGDASVEDTVLLGSMEYSPPIHYRNLDELREEQRRLGAL